MKAWGSLLASVIGQSVARAEGAQISAFNEVSDGLYRGARPTEDGLRFLADHGIRTVLNLENQWLMVKREQHFVESIGLRYFSEPLRTIFTPRDSQVDRILKLVADASYYPLFVHCQHGEDRTGMIMALHRIFAERWKPEAAREEMLRLGFHPALRALDRYFHRKARLGTK